MMVRFGRWTAAIALAVAYAVLAHYTISTTRAPTLGTVVALAPIVLAAFSLAWNTKYRTAALPLFGIACAALAPAWARLEQNYMWIYWSEHAGTQLVLCAIFGRTLVAGREPMCTYFARFVHGSLTPALERYTRQVTVAWTMFFASMAATSTILFFAAPLSVWSMFSNFFSAPLIGAMFVAEYVVRRCLHPDMEHAHILDAVNAYRNAPALSGNAKPDV